VMANGAGNLPIVRISAYARANAQSGNVNYEDHNYPDRAGWKEIVISAAPGATLRRASQASTDISKALTQYPSDPTLAPPQQLRAQLEWSLERTPERTLNAKSVVLQATPARSIVQPIEQPHAAPPASAPALMTPRSAAPGAVVRGDFLSRLLQQRQLSFPMLLVALAAAFALGAAHALTPGHGKTIVAAYLVGSRGTLKHAAFLGAMVTFTHTFVVFLLGIATLFLFRYMVPEKISAVLGAISGLSIVALGGWMLFKRIRGVHLHTHSHDEQVHSHVHVHQHTHVHDHSYSQHSHDHGHTHHHAHSHSHVPEEISWGGLVALGASGGLVPCESALVLLLGAIALGRVALGLLLLVAFSTGLALVLMTIGVLVLYAKNLLPKEKRNGGLALFKWLSVASPAIVIAVGMLTTCVSLGWIQPRWMIG
jgi:nickel/cobalt transporter (NicO) family protein